MNQEVVTVRPGLRRGWVVLVDRTDRELAFSTCELALEFARAYARLCRAGTVQVVNGKGAIEHQERVATADAPVRAA
ncbi:MAG TPA: hypothetical protein VML91_23605 [Burkholderiales bacterium]|nr:hypothetical protein [Burkholderiales bacterium]